jgi:hypothetical protein
MQAYLSQCNHGCQAERQRGLEREIAIWPNILALLAGKHPGRDHLTHDSGTMQQLLPESNVNGEAYSHEYGGFSGSNLRAAPPHHSTPQALMPLARTGSGVELSGMRDSQHGVGTYQWNANSCGASIEQKLEWVRFLVTIRR